MGNADQEAPGKRINYDEISPAGSIQGPNQLVMYDYPILGEIKEGAEFAREVMTEEMTAHLAKQGYDVVGGQSPEGQAFLGEFQAAVSAQLQPLGIESKVGIGTGVMIERIDNDPRRKVNIIIGVAKSQKDGGLFLIAHAADLDMDKKPYPSSQRRSDGRFQPPLFLIDKQHPFGYRETFAMVYSYPTARPATSAGAKKA